MKSEFTSDEYSTLQSLVQNELASYELQHFELPEDEKDEPELLGVIDYLTDLNFKLKSILER